MKYFKRHNLLQRAESFLGSPFLSQINPVHIVPSYFCKGQFNIIQSSMSGFSMQSLSFRITNKSLYAFLFSAYCHLLRPPFRPSFNYMNYICWRLESMKLLNRKFPQSFVQHFFTSYSLVIGVVSSWPSNKAGGPYATTYLKYSQVTPASSPPSRTGLHAFTSY